MGQQSVAVQCKNARLYFADSISTDLKLTQAAKHSSSLPNLTCLPHATAVKLRALRMCLAHGHIDMLRPFIIVQTMMTASLGVLAEIGLTLLSQIMGHKLHIVTQQA